MKIKNLFLLAALGLMASATLTSCEDVLGHWEKPTPTPITPPSGGETPVTPEEIIYSFSLRNLADDADVAATALKVTDQTGAEVATATSDGKYTIKSGELSSVTTLWLEATTATGKYIAKATKEELPAIAEAGKLKMATLGDVILADGNFYKAGTSSPVAMIAYLGTESDCSHGLAIQLNGSPVSKNWSEAKTYAEGLSAVPGGTWRLPSKADWQNMFVGCAKDGDDSDASDNLLNPIAGFKAKIIATGITWCTDSYWSSTDSGSDAWNVVVDLDASDPYAFFFENVTSASNSVLGCLAF